VGSVVWNLTDGKTGILEIKDQILQAYDVTKDELDQDLTEIIEQLVASKLILPVTVGNS